MLISGFTIIKNAVVNDYPIVEAITSILPVVDEMIVLAGDSKDDTVELIRSVNDPKIKIHNSVWNPALNKGGKALADETNKAFKLIDPDADWAFYIQADEVVHEKYHNKILEACKKFKHDNEVKGLLFKYLHFYGTYDYTGDSRKWYNKEIRIIRNDPAITSYKDAQGFRKDGRQLPVKLIDAYIYHYGWVKNPYQMKQKLYNAGKLWNSEEEMDAFLKTGELFDYSDFDSLIRFDGTHPAVMQKRIANKNWEVNFNIEQKKFSFKNRLLYWIEKKTGKRLFEFRNYKILK